MSRHPVWFLIGLLLFTAAVLASWRGEVSAGVGAPKDDWSALTTGQEVYEAACAACHGTRGTGTDRTLRGFDVSPPDFTDCAFSSREPAIDWYGIAHSGGPTKGFDRLMPAFGDVLTKEQIEAAVEHIKTYCKERRKWPVGEFNLAKPLNTGKAFPENEVAWSISTTVEEPFAVNGKFVVARRIGARHQIEAAVPVGCSRWSGPGTTAARASTGARGPGIWWRPGRACCGTPSGRAPSAV